MYGLPASADGKVAKRANTFCQITRDHPGWAWVGRLPELWWAWERGQDHQPHLRAWPTGVANRPTACLSFRCCMLLSAAMADHAGFQCFDCDLAAIATNSISCAHTTCSAHVCYLQRSCLLPAALMSATCASVFYPSTSTMPLLLPHNALPTP